MVPRKLFRLMILVVGLILLGPLLKCILFKYGKRRYQDAEKSESPTIASFFSSFCPESLSFCRNKKSFTFNGETQKCKIPELHPFNESILGYLSMGERNLSGDGLCKEFPLLFNSTLESEIVPAVDLQGFRKYGIVSCCYKVIKRKENTDKPDSYFKYSDECHELPLTIATRIPDEHEFIAIFCKDKKNRSQIHDMHAFISSTANLGLETPMKSNPDHLLNIMVLGVDSVSRMNFIRYMPNTYEFLMNTLNAVEMKGYNKIGVNTFRCLLPMLTGQYYEEVSKHCGKTKFFDTCPLIWRKFKGYGTLMAEDWAKVQIFHYEKNGFRNPPVDHYLRPLALASKEEFTEKRDQYVHCQGPRFTIQNLLDYTKKFVHKMNKVRQPFFSFTWATALTHMQLSYAKYADPYLLETLQWFYRKGHLENTLLILMSDHGIFWGDIRKTVQGQLEARLPFIYFVVPEQFQKRYPIAFQNLMGNRERLTSTKDLHETLSDLSDLGQLENDMIFKREKHLKSLQKAGGRLPRGISQFLPLPASRSCEDAGIDEFHCACKENIREVSASSNVVKEAALFAVAVMNKQLRDYRRCARLKLVRVTLAQVAMTKDRKRNGTMRRAFLLNYDTNPGSGGFEALVVEHKELPRLSKWKILGSISRSTLYRNQSYCVDDVDLKYFCFCKN